MAFNQVLSQLAPATIGTAGQVLVSAGSSASSYWASTIPVSAYSAQFSGAVGNYLSAGTSSTLALGAGDFTIEGWYYPTAWNANTSAIWDYRTNGGAATNVPCIFLSASGVPAVTFSAPSAAVITGSTALTLNAWNHLALVRSGTTVTLYLNGVSIGTTTSSATFGIQTLAIGNPISGATNYSYTGLISNFRIVKGVAVYTGAFTTPTSSLGTSQAAGTNISAVTPSQVSLLTCNGPGFTVTDSSPNAFTITNNGTVIASQFAPFSSFSAIARSATQTQTILTSGSGTYYTPSGVAWLRIRMVGGGGGGGASGSGASGGPQGSSGASTIFGSAQAYGGTGGYNNYVAGVGGVGGSGTIGSFTGIVINGGQGGVAGVGGSTLYHGGGIGGSSTFGGGASGGLNGAASSAATNSGCGGGGGGGTITSGVYGGFGGGAGGYVEAYISSPAVSYSYTVGAGGGGGAAGTNGTAGGGGGSGIIIVEENYAVNVSGAGSNITRGTAVASTSGTSIDFTSIPSWVKRITIVLQGISTSGSSVIELRLGSGSITATGYVGSGMYTPISPAGGTTSTTGFQVPGISATNIRSGVYTLINISGNIWVASGCGAYSEVAGSWQGGGNLTLSGTLDRVRLTTVNGTDTFDAGSVNILYE